MTYLKILLLSVLGLFITACSYRDGVDSIEDIYTDVKVIKASSGNYAGKVSESSKPILKETKYNSAPEYTQEEEQSVHIKKTGSIIDVAFEDNVKLYVYTFLSRNDQEQITFYYDKKLNYSSKTLLDIDVLDNFLITAKKHRGDTLKTKSNKKKYIKHKKRNYNIREAIEEKINTF